MLLPARFPVHERVASGVTYREMLSEFGVLTALVVGTLVALQLMDFFRPEGAVGYALCIGTGLAFVAGFGVYTWSLGNPLLFLLALIMMPLATTEIGTDAWIEEILKGVAPFHSGLVLVYTAFIMMVLRFFAGPIVHKLSPIGLLIACSALAIVGLYTLSITTGLMLFAAATLYGVGKTFFWPTMLGIAAERTPRGGALTLNALGGVGMLAVGTLGAPYIGALQADQRIEAIAGDEQLSGAVPGLVEGGELTVTEQRDIYEIIHYPGISEEALAGRLAALEPSRREEVEARIALLSAESRQGALAHMAVFPAIMLVCYVGLFVYYKSKGGYRPLELHALEEAAVPPPQHPGTEA
jgi:hypothetical protein